MPFVFPVNTEMSELSDLHNSSEEEEQVAENPASPGQPNNAGSGLVMPKIVEGTIPLPIGGHSQVAGKDRARIEAAGRIPEPLAAAPGQGVKDGRKGHLPTARRREAYTNRSGGL